MDRLITHRQLHLERRIQRLYREQRKIAWKNRNRSFARALDERILEQAFRIAALRRLLEEN